MSSKRKNTPTKLAKDEVVIQREKLEQCSDGDSNHGDSDSDSESSLSLHIVSKPEQLDEYRDSDSPGSERPQTKKQRLLQSVKCENSDSDSESQTNNNNMTKPNGGSQRKSMDNVLRRLSSKVSETVPQDGVNGVRVGENGGAVMENIKAAIGAEGSLKEKEKRLSDMIAQLQAMKESLAKVTEGEVNIHLYEKICIKVHSHQA